MPFKRDYRFLEDEATLQVRSDRRDHRPFGLYGGSPGGASENYFNHRKLSIFGGSNEIQKNILSKFVLGL